MSHYIVVFENDHLWETEADDVAEVETRAWHITNARIQTIFEAVSESEASQEATQVRAE